MSTKAYAAMSSTQPLAPYQINRREPGPHDVLIEIQFCAHRILTYNGYEKDGKTPTYGGYSTRIVVDENYVLKIPDNLPLDRAAPLLCASITTYSPLRH